MGWSSATTIEKWANIKIKTW